MAKKTTVLVIISLIVLGGIIYFSFFKNQESEYKLATVARGEVFREVLENGQVKQGESLELSFNNPGRIEKIYVQVGQSVAPGETVIKLETGELEIQAKQAQSDLKYYQAQLDKLLAGASSEEIRQAETSVANAETSVADAQENLNNVEKKAVEDLKGDYEDAVNALDSAYLKIYNAYIMVKSVQEDYFYYYDQESARVRANKGFIQEEMEKVKEYLDKAQASGRYDDIDQTLVIARESLSKIYQSLAIIRSTCEESSYKKTVSTADKAALDTEKTNINTALGNIISAQQTIASTILTNKSNIDTAQASLTKAQGTLQSAEDSLALLLAEPRESDIASYQAQIAKAESSYQLLLKQISDAYLKTPIKGQVSEINKEEGEMVNTLSGEAIVKVLPAAPFSIEAHIYEEDVVKINIGDKAYINLIAFPGKDIEGKVISISPAEKVIDKVVYYEVNISLEGIDNTIKPGMTADLAIRTDTKQDVLVIPDNAVIKKDNKYFAQVFQNGETKERAIEIGLEGSNDVVEVISGLSEGEEIIIEE